MIYLRAATNGQDWQPIDGVELLDDDVAEPKRVLVTRGVDLAGWDFDATYTSRHLPNAPAPTTTAAASCSRSS